MASLLDFIPWCWNNLQLPRLVPRPAWDVRDEKTAAIIIRIISERHANRALWLVAQQCEVDVVSNLVVQEYQTEVRALSLIGDTLDNIYREMYIKAGIKNINSTITYEIGRTRTYNLDDECSSVGVPEEPQESDQEEDDELQRRLANLRMPVYPQEPDTTTPPSLVDANHTTAVPVALHN